MSHLILTRDELMVFLAILGVPTMNGLDEQPLSGLNEREIAERLNSGEQSLVNRGLLDLSNPDKAALDDTLVALVGGSVFPEAIFLLSRLNPDGSNDPHYFNVTPELLVEHHSPRVGIYQFDYLPDIETLTQRVRVLLAALPSAVNSIGDVDLRVNSVTLTSFIERVQDKTLDAARHALLDAGIAEAIVDALLTDYTTYPSWVGIAAWDLRSEEPQGGEAVMVIGGAERCWLLESVTNQIDLVRLRQATNDECIQTLLRLIDPLKHSFHPSS